MTPSDLPPPERSAPRPPAADVDLLLDAMRGELPPRRLRALDARRAAEAPLAREAARLERFATAAREIHEPEPDAATARRVALRIRDRVAAEETAARREALTSRARRRLAWGRILAVSVAAHVVLLAFLVVHLHQEHVKLEERTRFVVGLPTPDLPARDEDVAWTEKIPDPWAGSRPADPRLPEEARLESPRVALLDDDLDLAPLADNLRDHPRHVALEMVTRRFETLKRRRLDRLGVDATGTLKAVSRGLRALAHRQHTDGSFATGGGRGEVGQTSLALLPFLGDGHGSRTGRHGPEVVARGIAFIRRGLFDAHGNARERTDVPVAELGMALRALSEDYVLSYGRLAPADARRRVRELVSLAATVERSQTPGGAFPGSGNDIRAAVWPMWGLEAAVRTGAVSVLGEVLKRFRGWWATTERGDPHVAAAGLLLGRELGEAFRPDARRQADVLLVAADDGPFDPFFVATAGAGLLLYDPAAFRTWNEGVGERLLEGLGPTGVVWQGDPVGDTALHLLALQAAWRTY